MKLITVKINRQGKVEIETSGFVGDACYAATAGIRTALAGTVESDVRTAEGYETEAASGQAETERA